MEGVPPVGVGDHHPEVVVEEGVHPQEGAVAVVVEELHQEAEVVVVVRDILVQVVGVVEEEPHFLVAKEVGEVEVVEERRMVKEAQVVLEVTRWWRVSIE